MTRMLLLTAALIMTVAAPGHASHYFEDFGFIWAPVPVTPSGPMTDLARCMKQTQSEFNEGHFGVIFDLSDHEANGMHDFSLRDAQMGMTPPPTNFDITFYADLGSCDPSALRPAVPTDPPTFAGPGDEIGVIPAGMRYAVVTTNNGAGVAFELRIWG